MPVCKISIMPSQEFMKFQAAMAEAAQQNPFPEFSTDQERRDHIDQMLGQRPLADGVMTQPTDADGVSSIWVVPEELADSSDCPIICYFHGGGYRIGSAAGWRPFGSYLAKVCSAKVLLVDYRLAPENPFPAAVEDALCAYRWLLKDTSADRVVLAGDSAGGGLAPATLLALRDEGLALPAGCACLSPWSDLTNSGDSFATNSGTDQLFSKQAADEAAASYLVDADPAHPHASPVFGDWKGLPPLLIQAGNVEVLEDDAKNLAAAAQTAGVDVRLKIFEGMPHVWQHAYPAYPEAVEAMEDIARFVADTTRP